MIVALSIRKKWARELIQETDMETQEIEATIKMDVIINNTRGAPVMGIEPIELIETIDVIINNTKGIPDISREHNIPTDANRHRQTPQNTERRCLSMSGGVNWRLLLSVCMSCSMEMSGGCLWDIWGVSGDI